MFQTVVAFLLLTALVFQVLHVWLLAGARLGMPPNPEMPAVKIPVSVIICAKNEATQLSRRLPRILTQDYHQNGSPAFEVVVADDDSTDETVTVIADLQKDFPQLRYLFIAPEKKLFPGKKGALVAAISEAKNEVLLLTDADCSANSVHWISQMRAALTTGTELVAGYAPYEKGSGFLNRFIRAEALLSFLHIAALHRRGIAYMATGRNLLVRRETFKAAAAHPLWTKTLSGDDDMLVRIAANRKNFAVQGSLEGAMQSPAKATLQEYIAQKQRHMSTGKYYRSSIKILFFLLNGSQFLVWALLPVALVIVLAGSASSLLISLLLLVLLRIVVFSLVLAQAARRQAAELPFCFFPLFDAATALHSLFFAPYIFWKNKTTWK